ncbi:MAG: MTAP family purine nucleoside phosphorylase [Candidatus Nezhaarchaeota archaeon]|nr:MTAP family purine nucleoside phosphorylase [Candidatus Nezhaarchaeota archaeon]
MRVSTRFGSVETSLTKLGGVEVAVVPRHGFTHAVPPHRVDYRANVLALKRLGVERVLATGAVGSLREHIRPGMAVVVSDFLDLAKSRPPSLYEGPKVVHVDMSEPFCPELRTVLIEASKKAGLEVWDGGVYACTEGPRFETPAEIRAIRVLGGDVVGMTVATEAALAREAGLCYAVLCLVTNMAAGMQSMVTAGEVARVMDSIKHKVYLSLEEAVALIPAERGCSCPYRSGQ